MARTRKQERARKKKSRLRMKKRIGTVIFIERYPDGMKDWLHERAARNGRSMTAEAAAIIEAERARG